MSVTEKAHRELRNEERFSCLCIFPYLHTIISTEERRRRRQTHC